MMQPATPHNARLLLAGKPGGELRLAAEMARQSGAHVTQADNIEAAIVLARSAGGDLAMVDVELDIARFIEALRAERIALPVIACGIEASAERAVAAIRAGARDYVPLPPDKDLIAAAITSVTLRSVTMLGDHPSFRKALNYATAMARANAAILVRGPSGSGKELMARNIHAASGRSGPFITVECEGVSAEVLESELFGHVAGAFSGAVADRSGRMEEAAGGTLFLREIAALSPALQARLAEALVYGSFTRQGSEERIALSARLIAASRSDLRALVVQGHFRADLMHRLGLVEILLPSLAERGEDMTLLARHFAVTSAQDNGVPQRALSDAALALLHRYDWPENIRELEAVIHRAVLLSDGGVIGPASLVLADGVQMGMACTHKADATPAAGGQAALSSLVGRTVDDVERELILRTLGHCGGNRTTASSILGISVRTMRNKLREFSQAGFPVS
jgi:two-component system, NtrC family, response regulator HydG